MIKKMNVLSVLLFSMLFVILSCEKELIESDDNQNAEALKSVDEANLKCASRRILIEYKIVNTMSVEQIVAVAGPSFAHLVKNGINMYKVSYITHYGRRPIRVSGVVGVPDTIINNKTPIVMYNHGTRVSEADLLPSSGMDIVPVLAAANGKICFAADYIGYGDSKQIFPTYMIAKATVYSACDMVIAGREFLKEEFSIYTKPSITMFGYSQGGSVTMAAQRVLENNPYYRRQLHLKGVAMGTGPYDLHDQTLIPIIKADTYSGTAFITYVFTAYNYHYRLNYDLDKIFKNSYGQLFLDLVEQNLTYAEINAQLPTEMSELFQDDFREALIAGNTPFNRLFEMNSVYKGWVPKSPTRIYHSRTDEIVPFGNAETAYNAFVELGAKDVTLIPYPQFDHVTTAFVSFMDILQWVDSQD